MAGTMGGAMPNPDRVGAAPKTKTFATVTADIDLVALGGAPCRKIRVGTAGNLAVAYTGDSGDLADTILGLLAGETIEVNANKILLSGTTAAKVTVFW